MTAVEKEIPWTSNKPINRRDQLLARLSADPQKPATERRPLPRSVEARLVSLLTEIDETVLSRVLRLYSGPREIAQLIISHRRLIDINLPGRAAIPAGAEDQANLLATRLVEIAEMRGELSLTIGRRPAHPNQAENACSITSLGHALNVATTQNGFDRLLRQAAAMSVAQLIWSDDIAQPHFSGAHGWITLLRMFAEKYRTTGPVQKVGAAFGPLRTEGLAIPLTAGELLVIASLEKKGFAAILPRAEGLKLIAAWQSY